MSLGIAQVLFSLKAGDDESVVENIIPGLAPVPEVGGCVGAEDGVELVFDGFEVFCGGGDLRQGLGLEGWFASREAGGEERAKGAEGGGSRGERTFLVRKDFGELKKANGGGVGEDFEEAARVIARGMGESGGKAGGFELLDEGENFRDVGEAEVDGIGAGVLFAVETVRETVGFSGAAGIGDQDGGVEADVAGSLADEIFEPRENVAMVGFAVQMPEVETAAGKFE